VHDIDIKRWSLIEEIKIKFNFKACDSFIDEFKKKFSISSRKVQKLISIKHILEKEKLDSEAQKFRSEILNEIQNFDHKLVLNSDQSRFNYGPTSKKKCQK
jgi:hypothetical protein